MGGAPDPNADGSADAALVRPFLSRLLSPALDSRSAEDVPEAAGVRSYAMTGGRSTAVIPLEFESMLQTTARGDVVLGSLSFERGAIVQLCSTEILSVAELSARLRLPIGVVRVVAADLLSEGLLEAFMSNLSVADDVSLISRLIEGVRAL